MGDTRTTTETEHRWFAYGHWYNGYGSSMDPHCCGDPSEPCVTRTRTVTVIEGDWSKWERKHG